MLKVISFFIGVHSKHAWACWDSARAIDFYFPDWDEFPHAFIVNVKLSAGRIDLKWETLYLLACRLIFISVNMSPLSDFFERVKFYDCLLKFFLTAKGINVPGMAAMSHTNILRISEIQMVFWNNRNENIGGQQ